MVVIVWYLGLQLPVQSVPITTNVVSSNLVHGKVYLIQYYVIKFVSDLRQVGGFLHQLNWPPQYNWNIVESGVKNHKPNQIIMKNSWDDFFLFICHLSFILWMMLFIYYFLMFNFVSNTKKNNFFFITYLYFQKHKINKCAMLFYFLL